MIDGRQAYDADTGHALSEDDAQAAADNPRVYAWVVWRS